MVAEPTPTDVSAALAGVRRRARYLQEANGSWSWPEVFNLIVPVGLAVYMMWWADLELPTLGLVLLVSSIGGWQHRRLKARVDALTKLLTEIDYPGEA